MKRSVLGHRKSPVLPIAWREAEYSALRVNAADTFDDRVSEDIFDVEGEWAEIELIVHARNYSSN